MFEIEYKGGNSVVLTTKKIRVAVDPKTSLIGLKDVDTKDSIELATEQRFLTNSGKEKLIIEGPGEYEIGDISVRGVAARRHIDDDSKESLATIYRIAVGDVRIAVIGNVAPTLTEDQLEEIGVIDLLVIPVGGAGYTLDATAAATITRQVEPHAVIPVHYADSGVKYEVPQDVVDTFVKEMSVDVMEAGTKFKVKAGSSIPASLTIIKLDRN